MSRPTLLERRRADLAREIRHAALQLFDQRGFDMVSVQDIAAAAGVSPRTFFRHFGSKDDIVLDYQRSLDDRLVQALHDRPADEGAATALRNAFVETSHVRPEDHDAVLVRVRVLAASPDLRARARGERGENLPRLADALAERMGVSAARDQRPLIVAAGMQAVAVAVWERWTAAGEPRDPSRAIGAALDELMDGLRGFDEVRPRDPRGAARRREGGPRDAS